MNAICRGLKSSAIDQPLEQAKESHQRISGGSASSSVSAQAGSRCEMLQLANEAATAQARAVPASGALAFSVAGFRMRPTAPLVRHFERTTEHGTARG
jgi:hypothetical protein